MFVCPTGIFERFVLMNVVILVYYFIACMFIISPAGSTLASRGFAPRGTITSFITYPAEKMRMIILSIKIFGK